MGILAKLLEAIIAPVVIRVLGSFLSRVNSNPDFEAKADQVLVQLSSAKTADEKRAANRALWELHRG